MDKKEEVTLILKRIRERTDELLDNEVTEEMTAEEIVTLATEMTTFIPVTTMEYTQPIGTVDTTRVTFMLDDEFEFPLYSEEYYDDDI